MLMARFPLKRLLAALLPLGFLWLFVACVSICTEESREHLTQSAAISSALVTASSGCEGCPLSSFPKAMVPQRSTFHLDLQTPLVVPSLTFAVDALADGVAVVAPHSQSPFSSPPLDRLPLLRI
jgi:hypothetical protein